MEYYYYFPKAADNALTRFSERLVKMENPGFQIQKGLNSPKRDHTTKKSYIRRKRPRLRIRIRNVIFTTKT